MSLQLELLLYQRARVETKQPILAPFAAAGINGDPIVPTGAGPTPSDDANYVPVEDSLFDARLRMGMEDAAVVVKELLRDGEVHGDGAEEEDLLLDDGLSLEVAP